MDDSFLELILIVNRAVLGHRKIVLVKLILFASIFYDNIQLPINLTIQPHKYFYLKLHLMIDKC